jgi:hypothetical protein
MGLCFTGLTDARASVDICQAPVAYSHLSIAVDKHSDSTIDQVPGAIGQENRNFDLIFTTAEDHLLFGAGHRYTIFDIDPLQPGTNGHLHTFFLPLHKLTPALRLHSQRHPMSSITAKLRKMLSSYWRRSSGAGVFRIERVCATDSAGTIVSATTRYIP